MKGSPTYGIVFSGGGALGAWEVGCYDALKAHHGGAPPVIVTGASAGALNAVGVCAGMLPPQLQGLWADIAPEDVYRFPFSKRDLLRIVFARGERIQEKLLSFLSKYKSIYDTTPFESTLRRIIAPYYEGFITSQIYFALSVTNLNDSKPEYFYKIPVGMTPPAAQSRGVTWRKVDSVELLLNGLMGSTALPVLFPPVNHYFDGGVLLNQPINPALFLRDPEPDILYVIIPTARALGEIDDVIAIGQTVMTTWIAASLESQLNRLRLRNKMRTERTKGQPDERLPICVIRPSVDLGVTFGVSLLSFGSNVKALVDHGQTTAFKKLSQFDPDEEKETTWYE